MDQTNRDETHTIVSESATEHWGKPQLTVDSLLRRLTSLHSEPDNALDDWRRRNLSKGMQTERW